MKTADIPEEKSGATLDDEALGTWLKLVLTPGVGAVTGQLLLRRFGSPEAIFDATYRQLQRQLNQEKVSRALLADDPQRDAAIIRTLAWLHADDDHHILTLDDPRYPRALLDLPDPPLLVYARGSLEALVPDAVALIGSRRASHDGLHNAHAFAQALARRGLVVTSGLAEGIDAASHVGALDGAAVGQPSTIAVLGAGIDRIYPAHHRMLATRIIAQQGLILSEQPLGSAPTRGNFPRRNRMIAALSRGTLVVEAALRSGSLITARLAAELGRDVMAVPGSIHNPLSHGCHHLIRDGASLVETVDDILTTLGMALPPGAPGTLTAGRLRARQHTARRASGWRDWQEIIGRTENGQAGLDELAGQDEANEREARHGSDDPRNDDPGQGPATRDRPDETGSPDEPARQDDHAGPDTPNGTESRNTPDEPASSARKQNPPLNRHARNAANALNAPDAIPAPADPASQILAALTGAPLSAEELASRLGWPIERILITIQLLELGGQIGRHVDGRWQRI